MNTKRFKNFATIIYEDSVSEKWEEALSNLHVPCIVSPVHDKDIKEDGSIKKPHRHILFLMPSLQSIEQAESIINTINAVGIEIVRSARSYARYLIHLDEAPHKTLYSIDEIKCFGGADFRKYLDDQPLRSKTEVLSEICDFATQNNILEFCDIVNYARENNLQDWFYYLCGSSAYFMQAFLRSLHFKNKQ